MRRSIAFATLGLVLVSSLIALAANEQDTQRGTRVQVQTGAIERSDTTAADRDRAGRLASKIVGRLKHGEMILESDKLTDLNVYNDQEAKLGSIDNLIIDAHTGQVLYGLLDTGLGGKHVPVPWAALRLSKAEGSDNFSYLLNMSKDQFANAPTYDSDHRPDFTNDQWQQSVNRFFGVRTVARPMQRD